MIAGGEGPEIHNTSPCRYRAFTSRGCLQGFDFLGMVGQYNIFTQAIDFSGKNVGVGLSGGINSAAVLCWLADLPAERRPAKVALVYCHFREHSPDTARFVFDLVRFARSAFENVILRVYRGSILDYFENERFIPHPRFSPCTQDLKLARIADFYIANGVTIDLIGYVRTERNRIRRQGKARQGNASVCRAVSHSRF